MKRYTLDLTKVPKDKIPEVWGDGPLEVPLVEGKYDHDYDLVEDEVGQEWLAKIRSRQMDAVTRSEAERAVCAERPMGIDRRCFPVYARLIALD